MPKMHETAGSKPAVFLLLAVALNKSKNMISLMSKDNSYTQTNKHNLSSENSTPSARMRKISFVFSFFSLFSCNFFGIKSKGNESKIRSLTGRANSTSVKMEQLYGNDRQ